MHRRVLMDNRGCTGSLFRPDRAAPSPVRPGVLQGDNSVSVRPTQREDPGRSELQPPVRKAFWARARNLLEHTA